MQVRHTGSVYIIWALILSDLSQSLLTQQSGRQGPAQLCKALLPPVLGCDACAKSQPMTQDMCLMHSY